MSDAWNRFRTARDALSTALSDLHDNNYMLRQGEKMEELISEPERKAVGELITLCKEFLEECGES